VVDRTLRAPCNILIGACALCDVIHQLGHFPQNWQIYLGGTLDSLSCSVIMVCGFLPVLGVAAGTMSVLCIGIDRFLSIAAPTTYRNMSTAAYLTVCFLYTFCIIIFVSLHEIDYLSRRDGICNIPQVYHGNAIRIWTMFAFILNLTALIFYIVTWRLIRSKDNLARIFRTILLVTIFDIGGWALTCIVVAMTNSVPRPVHKRFCYNCFAGIFVNFGVAVKCFVYYFTR
ncbi:hypothetical protein PFISCL1PPCAC_7304, partial [Pristionchus fissidentatus]